MSYYHTKALGLSWLILAYARLPRLVLLSQQGYVANAIVRPDCWHNLCQAVTGIYLANVFFSAIF